MSQELLTVVNVLGLLALLAIFVVACFQIVRRYLVTPLVMVGWLVAVFMVPFAGVLAWFIWHGWLAGCRPAPVHR